MHIDAIFCERIPNEYIYTIFLLIHTKCNLEAKKRKNKIVSNKQKKSLFNP